MGFCINDVKTVVELYDEKQVNSYLKSGWTLLSVGFDTGVDASTKIYILGNLSLAEPFKQDKNSKLTKLLNEET